MILTNHYGLPDPFVRAVEYDDYDRVGDISVTSLIKPPQMVQLERQYEDEIEEDVSDRVWLLLGSAAHEVLYRAGQAPLIQEMRVTMPAMGWTVSGKSDLLDTERNLIVDWKVTSVWSALSDKPDWEAQLNLYRILYESQGWQVDGLQIVAILRDWQLSRAGKDDYPSVPVMAIDVPLWEHYVAEDYLSHRVMLHQSAAEGRYEGCTDEERWLRRKEYIRCQRYCRVAEFCGQWNGS